jgi:hypothetical protein
VTIDILLYGSSLAWSSFADRTARQGTNLPAIQSPGGLFGAVFIGIFPPFCSAFRSCVATREIFGLSSLLFGVILIGAGFLAYAIDLALRPARSAPPSSAGLD